MRKSIISGLAIISIVALTGCVTQEQLLVQEEESLLQKDCTTVFENAAPIYEWDDDDVINGWQRTYAAFNAGVATREKARTEVERMFPWMDEAVADYVEIHGYERFSAYMNLDRYAIALALNELVDGSSAAPAFTSSELSQILNSPDDAEGRDKVADLVYTPQFELYTVNRPSVFSECDNLIGDQGRFEANFGQRWNGTLNTAERAVGQLLQILSCETRGEWDGRACASEDFELDPLPMERRNPFTVPFSGETTQSLAEFAWCWDLGLEVRPDRLGCW